MDQTLENKIWTYDRIQDAYGASHSTIAGVAKRFVMDGLEAALGRKVQENRYRKVIGDVETKICAIACSQPPEGTSRWTMQVIADELIRLEVVDYITDSTGFRRDSPVYFRCPVPAGRKNSPCYG